MNSGRTNRFSDLPQETSLHSIRLFELRCRINPKNTMNQGNLWGQVTPISVLDLIYVHFIVRFCVVKTILLPFYICRIIWAMKIKLELLEINRLEGRIFWRIMESLILNSFDHYLYRWFIIYCHAPFQLVQL